MPVDATVTRWHAAIIADCGRVVKRPVQEAERRFVTSREGFIALESIHDYVKDVATDPVKLGEYLNSETSNRAQQP
jgi:hypothetical protein